MNCSLVLADSEVAIEGKSDYSTPSARFSVSVSEVVCQWPTTRIVWMFYVRDAIRTRDTCLTISQLVIKENRLQNKTLWYSKVRSAIRLDIHHTSTSAGPLNGVFWDRSLSLALIRLYYGMLIGRFFWFCKYTSLWYCCTNHSISVFVLLYLEVITVKEVL